MATELMGSAWTLASFRSHTSSPGSNGAASLPWRMYAAAVNMGRNGMPPAGAHQRKYLERLHRLRAAPHRAKVHLAPAPRHLRRQRRRHHGWHGHDGTPGLFAAVIDAAPGPDMIRFELTPNGPGNIVEFGTVKGRDGFDGVLKMSAYHHVKDRNAVPRRPYRDRLQ